MRPVFRIVYGMLNYLISTLLIDHSAGYCSILLVLPSTQAPEDRRLRRAFPHRCRAWIWHQIRIQIRISGCLAASFSRGLVAGGSRCPGTFLGSC